MSPPVRALIVVVLAGGAPVIVTAACALFRPGPFREAGGLDPAFRNGLEDVDLCLRLGEMGHQVHYCPASVVIHLESATMRFKGEGRHFSEDEAKGVHVLMDIISRYAMEATVWWETGQGEKIDGKGNPVPDPKREDNKKPSPSVGRP